MIAISRFRYAYYIVIIGPGQIFKQVQGRGRSLFCYAYSLGAALRNHTIKKLRQGFGQMALRNYARGPHRFASRSPALSKLFNFASPAAPIHHFSPAVLHFPPKFSSPAARAIFPRLRRCPNVLKRTDLLVGITACWLRNSHGGR